MNRPRVLVADDHRVMLDSLVQLLSSEFEVVAAVRDGISVVTSTERLGPDLLVLDIAMPGLSGIAAAARVRKNGSTAKVVFVTNLHDRAFVRESLALGAGRFRRHGTGGRGYDACDANRLATCRRVTG